MFQKNMYIYMCCHVLHSMAVSICRGLSDRTQFLSLTWRDTIILGFPFLCIFVACFSSRHFFVLRCYHHQVVVITVAHLRVHATLLEVHVFNNSVCRV